MLGAKLGGRSNFPKPAADEGQSPALTGSPGSHGVALAIAVQGATIEQPGSVYDTRGLISV
jgi:hypothetical protein